jgi:hypothetical protein
MYTVAHGSGCMKPDGTVDVEAHPLFVWAIGGLTPNGPSWTTVLLRQNQIDNEAAHMAMQAGVPLPLSKVPLGGRNGVLYSPVHDPTDEASLNRLFTTADRFTHARGFADRIRYTPPELRSEFHSLALARWDSMQEANPAARRQGQRPEPLPSAIDHVWKKWLKDRRELHGQPQYIGIPLVGQGYQRVHLEGAKALLSFLPLNKRGTSVRLGPLRDAFLRHAAVLLAVPECYQRQLTALGVVVCLQRRTALYVEANFAVANRLGVDDIVRFFASVGVQPEEAERWRPWAAAFVKMELEDRPMATHAPLLKFAREQAVTLIEGDPKWVLTGVHADSPGNWDPQLKRRREERASQLRAAQPEAGPSLAPDGASAHLGQSLPAHMDGADPLADALNYDPSDDGYSEKHGDDAPTGPEELDDDALMGPG